MLSDVRTLKQPDESMNAFIAAAVGREVRRRQALAAHQVIVALRDQVRQRTGVHPDATALIRALRDGHARDA
ncbi:MAG: hypothetical protein HYX52_05115 [Chloroflexi bacterium]|nr:hypothetical protein [Chloroflexota bacterium]